MCVDLCTCSSGNAALTPPGKVCHKKSLHLLYRLMYLRWQESCDTKNTVSNKIFINYMFNFWGIPYAILSPLHLQENSGDTTNNATFNNSLHNNENRWNDNDYGGSKDERWLDQGERDDGKMKRKSRQMISPTNLCNYFEMRLESRLTCSNTGCSCLVSSTTKLSAPPL